MASNLNYGMSAVLALGLVLSAGCPTPDKETADTAPTGCENGIDETIPADGAVDAYYRADVEFQLDDADESGPSIVLSSGGTDVAGTSWTDDDNEVVYFTPDSPLDPATSYTATLTYCVGDASIDFTTSPLGMALDTDLTDNTYAIDLASARFVEPAGVGDLIGEFVTMNVLVGVTAYTEGGTIDMLGALSEDNSTVQDYCTPTFPFPQADFSEAPYFSVGPADITLAVAGYEIPMQDLEISGTFADDGSYFGGAVLGGMIDARDIVEMIDEVDSWEDACNLTASFGAPCVACDDGIEACLVLLADQIVAEQVPDQVIDEVLKENTHPDCPDTPDTEVPE